MLNILRMSLFYHVTEKGSGACSSIGGVKNSSNATVSEDGSDGIKVEGASPVFALCRIGHPSR